MDQINEYLLEVKSHLHLEDPVERDIVSELYAHLSEKAREIHLSGKSMERSYDLAVRSMGRPRAIAGLLYEAHIVGRARDAFLTGLPYAIVSLLFATHLWRDPTIAPVAFAAIVAITLLGWRWGKPKWLYSWIGFSLFPLLVAGFALRHPVLTAVRAIMLHETTPVILITGTGTTLFYLVALGLIISTIIRVARRDWLLASFMLLPLPALGIWLYHLEEIGGFFQPVAPYLFKWDVQIATVLALMAISLATYVRLRQRKYRMISLIIIGTNAFAYVTHTIWNELRFFPVILVSVCLLAFLLSPIFAIKPPAKHGEEISQWIRELESS